MKLEDAVVEAAKDRMRRVFRVLAAPPKPYKIRLIQTSWGKYATGYKVIVEEL